MGCLGANKKEKKKVRLSVVSLDDTRPLSLQEVSNDTSWCANQSAGAHLNLTGHWTTGACVCLLGGGGRGRKEGGEGGC